MAVDRSVQLTPKQRAHKVKARRLIEAVGGLLPAERYCRLAKSQLSDCCSENTLTFMPADVIEDLEEVAGEPLYTRHLAKSASYEMVRLPDPHAEPTVWSARIGALVKENSELSTGLCAALTSGNDVDPLEAAALLGEAADNTRTAVELEEALKQRAALRHGSGQAEGA